MSLFQSEDGVSTTPTRSFGSMVEWLQCRLVTPCGTGSNPVGAAKEEQLCVGASGDCSPTTLHIAPSSKDRISDFDSENGGLNPSGATIINFIKNLNKMKTLWKTLIYPFQMIWDSIFDNDAGKIVSKRGLIELMKHDEEAGMYDVDFSEKSKENLD